MRGHHIYKEIWTPVIGEDLMCEREPVDPYAVAVINDSSLVEMDPRPRHHPLQDPPVLQSRGTLFKRLQNL